MGTFITGGFHWINDQAQNPLFIYRGKDSQQGETRRVSCTLDQMKELREQLHSVSEGRF